MSTQVLNVVLLSTGSGSSRAEVVLASLPESFRRSNSTAGAVVVMDGESGWVDTATAALRDGAIGLVVVAPAPADLGPLRAALAARRAPIVVDSPWASNPAVPHAATLIQNAITEATHAECRLIQPVGTDFDHALVHQLSLVRSLFGPITELSVVSRTSHHLQGRVLCGGLIVDLTITCTDSQASTAITRMLLPVGSVGVRIPTPNTARPATVQVVGVSGITTQPSLFESGHRATWRRLRDLLKDGEVPSDVEALESDLALLRHAGAAPHA